MKRARLPFGRRARLFWQRPTLARPVVKLPSALQRFTSVFGMGTGGSTALRSPDPARTVRLAALRLNPMRCDASAAIPAAMAPRNPVKSFLTKNPAEKTAPVAAATAPVSSGPKTGPNRLVVRTEGEAWIEIKDSADRMLVSSLNPAGSERVVRGRPPYTLVIGNASSVRVTYDDKPIDLAPHTRQDVARLTVP